MTNVVSMVERLESLARTVNLKYNVTHGGSEILLSSDMFCVQVVLDNTALVKDVIISHNGDATLRVSHIPFIKILKISIHHYFIFY